MLYCHDGNKNVSDMVTPDGTVAAHYEYSSFGKVVMSSSGELAAGLPPHLLNPYRFSSEYHDDALALVYYNYRHYNPADGRGICGRAHDLTRRRYLTMIISPFFFSSFSPVASGLSVNFSFVSSSSLNVVVVGCP